MPTLVIGCGAALGRVEGAGGAGRAQADRLVAGGSGSRVVVRVLELDGDLPAVSRDEGQRRAGDHHLAATAGLTTMVGDVAELTPLALVLKPISMVSALS